MSWYDVNYYIKFAILQKLDETFHVMMHIQIPCNFIGIIDLTKSQFSVKNIRFSFSDVNGRIALFAWFSFKQGSQILMLLLPRTQPHIVVLKFRQVWDIRVISAIRYLSPKKHSFH